MHIRLTYWLLVGHHQYTAVMTIGTTYICGKNRLDISLIWMHSYLGLSASYKYLQLYLVSDSFRNVRKKNTITKLKGFSGEENKIKSLQKHNHDYVKVSCICQSLLLWSAIKAHYFNSKVFDFKSLKMLPQTPLNFLSS